MNTPVNKTKVTRQSLEKYFNKVHQAVRALDPEFQQVRTAVNKLEGEKETEKQNHIQLMVELVKLEEIEAAAIDRLKLCVPSILTKLWPMLYEYAFDRLELTGFLEKLGVYAGLAPEGYRAKIAKNLVEHYEKQRNDKDRINPLLKSLAKRLRGYLNRILIDDYDKHKSFIFEKMVSFEKEFASKIQRGHSERRA